MAKKKSSTEGFFKELFSNVIFASFTEFFKNIIYDFQEAVYHTSRKIIESLFTGFIMCVGIGMILISFPFFLSYYLDLPPSLFFIILGFILIIISMIFFDRINKTKYKN